MSTKQTTSYVDKMREAMRSKATAKSTSANPDEWTPDFGTTRIRILPPIGPDFETNPMSIDESSLFYNTHKFHFIPEDLASIGTSSTKGSFLWVARTLMDRQNNERKNPIAEAVSQFYAVGRKDQDNNLLRLAGALKLKRHFFMNILKYNEDGTCEYKILTDRTNEGKLTKMICAAMGIPFFRDVEDNWVDKNSLDYDPDQAYYDLIDTANGYDFKIVKEKTGSNAWDISFEKSFVITKAPRALSQDELDLMAKRVDLRSNVLIERSYEAVETIFNNLMETAPGDEGDEVVVEASSKPKPQVKAPVMKSPSASSIDEESMDKMLDELDD